MYQFLCHFLFAVFGFVFETRFCAVAHAGFKLTAVLLPQLLSVGIANVSDDISLCFSFVNSSDSKATEKLQSVMLNLMSESPVYRLICRPVCSDKFSHEMEKNSVRYMVTPARLNLQCALRVPDYPQ